VVVLSTLAFFSSAFILVAPFFSKLFIDNVFISKDLAKFIRFASWGVILFILSTLFGVITDVIKNKVSIKIRLDLANKFIRKLYSLDLNFFYSNSVGENAYRMSETEIISDFLVEQLPQMLSDLLRTLIILAIALYLNYQMTLLLLVSSPLFLLHGLFIQNKLRPIYEEIWKQSANISKEIHESFSKILIIKVFGLEMFKRHHYLSSLIKNLRLRIKSFRWGIISSLFSSFISKAIYGAITLFGGWLIIKGRLSIGGYTAIMIYLVQLGGLLESLSFRFKGLIQQTVSLEKLFEVMDMQPQIIDTPSARHLESLRGEVSFRNVWFGYTQGKAILREINFTIPAFSWVGIVGPSGCGKTTMTNLILRLYDPWQGEITLDGHNLKKIKLSSLKEKVAIATQQPALFDVSLGENIGYGLRQVSQHDIEAAAKDACVHDFIMQLPACYDTLIGEDACRLSQGLKQRIALARAILRNPQLLILDEATSSVDSLTEEKIFRNLRGKRHGLTTIIISHRLFSVKDAERVYFLKKNGELEEGRHAELLSTSQQYGEFFRNQTE